MSALPFAPGRHTHLYLGALAASLALMAAAQSAPAARAAIVPPAPSYASLVAACKGERLLITWVDPHTDSAMLTVCATHQVRVGK